VLAYSRRRRRLDEPVVQGSFHNQLQQTESSKAKQL
jgi:hypothetical protein